MSAAGDRGGSARGTWLVARREITERMSTKSFYIATALLMVVIIGLGLLSRLVGGDEPDALKVGLTVSAPAALAGALTQTAEAAGRDATVESYTDDEAALAALEDGEVDAVVLPAQPRVVFAETVDAETFAIVRQAAISVTVEQALLDRGLTPDQITEALAAEPLEATTLDGGEDQAGLEVLIGTAAGVLLFVSIQMFGTYVLTGVVEEKSTAVVEVVLVRARPDQLLAGKVIGIGVAALVQFFLAVGAALVALLLSGREIPGEIWAAVPMTLLWFLGGYALYSTLFALAGSLVSRQEDAQAAATPINTVLIGSYLLIFFFGYVPESTASTVMSLIPPIAPFLMPMRMAAGAASTTEVVVALVLLLVTIIAIWKIAARIFEQVLLRRGTRISWRGAAALLPPGR